MNASSGQESAPLLTAPRASPRVQTHVCDRETTEQVGHTPPQLPGGLSYFHRALTGLGYALTPREADVKPLDGSATPHTQPGPKGPTAAKPGSSMPAGQPAFLVTGKPQGSAVAHSVRVTRAERATRCTLPPTLPTSGRQRPGTQAHSSPHSIQEVRGRGSRLLPRLLLLLALPPSLGRNQ